MYCHRATVPLCPKGGPQIFFFIFDRSQTLKISPLPFFVKSCPTVNLCFYRQNKCKLKKKNLLHRGLRGVP